jgi:hypothetical protein
METGSVQLRKEVVAVESKGELTNSHFSRNLTE